MIVRRVVARLGVIVRRVVASRGMIMLRVAVIMIRRTLGSCGRRLRRRRRPVRGMHVRVRM